tara:strand:+ start:114 stop:479 length:366 start_codon:yes stop_codon:yes gene_type:complete
VLVVQLLQLVTLELLQQVLVFLLQVVEQEEIMEVVQVDQVDQVVVEQDLRVDQEEVVQEIPLQLHHLKDLMVEMVLAVTLVMDLAVAVAVLQLLVQMHLQDLTLQEEQVEQEQHHLLQEVQ